MENSKYPLVSVVIPSYNGMPYLQAAIESVLAQDYPNVELIVLDDGSTDNTARYLEQYKGQFYFETHRNMGQAQTVNKGWQMSKGQFIGYLSADDTLEPNAISLSVQYLLENPEVILTYGDNILINADSQPIRTLITKEFDFYQLFLESTTPVAVGSFFRREGFETIGGWDKNFVQIGDYEFHLRLCQLGKFKRIPHILGCHRIHEESASYRKINFDRADEYVRLLSSQLATTKDEKLLEIKDQILSQAYLISGRTHWRSSRYKVGLKYFSKAFILNPKALYAAKTYRIILNAVLNRSLHALLKKYKKTINRLKRGNA
ncbi:glycosyl transferase, family 2 (plasmid) [Legionella adelaidensis]|uniref:Glycosyl transferase, family 2 n=1 Tax=Legionella adelaidensis TaxID=45056 RepID=A0A0W0R4N8_9GAMM|nr:glycosyltransferase [Legionella adelaidensis]KTC66038.1 glycosyl transferase, family 2 [Legionella adelaidensis]VEH85697.1 glycosyl transferase, family 2 [Legionella adelaidensis]